MPHKTNSDKATLLHIVTESGKDIKMTLDHLIAAGPCDITTSTSLKLSLIYASQGMERFALIKNINIRQQNN